MVSLSLLWLPILAAAAFVFVASNTLWMALPFWHRSDYGKLTEEKAVLDALSSSKSGQYIVPCADWRKLTPEQRAEMQLVWQAVESGHQGNDRRYDLQPSDRRRVRLAVAALINHDAHTRQ